MLQWYQHKVVPSRAILNFPYSNTCSKLEECQMSGGIISEYLHGSEL